MKKQDLLDYLDDYLKISDFQDVAKNGLQVDNSKEEINKIWYSVDTSTYILDRAIENNVDLVLSHHGMFWGEEKILTWLQYKRVKQLIGNDIALYAAHLPLDAHREVGNNIGLIYAFINMFWLQEGEYVIEKFWEVWYGLHFDHKVYISNLVTPYAEMMQLIKRLYNFWKKEYINSIAVVTGRASSNIQDAFNEKYDVFITWELTHEYYVLAKELWQSVLVWGHYETEKIWPKLLAYHLRDKFGLEIEFLDEKY